MDFACVARILVRFLGRLVGGRGGEERIGKNTPIPQIAVSLETSLQKCPRKECAQERILPNKFEARPPQGLPRGPHKDPARNLIAAQIPARMSATGGDPSKGPGNRAGPSKGPRSRAQSQQDVRNRAQIKQETLDPKP